MFNKPIEDVLGKKYYQKLNEAAPKTQNTADGSLSDAEVNQLLKAECGPV